MFTRTRTDRWETRTIVLEGIYVSRLNKNNLSIKNGHNSSISDFNYIRSYVIDVLSIVRHYNTIA